MGSKDRKQDHQPNFQLFENTTILKNKLSWVAETQTFSTGKGTQTSHEIGHTDARLESTTVLISNKVRNRIVKARNGNIESKNHLKIIHWNAGSRLWANKLGEIENLLLDLKPDVCYISEANLWGDLQPEERQLVG